MDKNNDIRCYNPLIPTEREFSYYAHKANIVSLKNTNLISIF